MASVMLDDDRTLSPLERFIRDYVETIGGEWDEIEPRVYELLLPDHKGDGAFWNGEPNLMRVAFDPEALPEHPGAQLASLGTPLVDRMLHAAVERGRLVELHLLGLNLQPNLLPARLARLLLLADDMRLEVERARPLDFPQAVFWFEATFAADQREQEILPIAIDLHHGREARHLDALLDAARLAECPAATLPEARCVERTVAYAIARDQVVRTVAALANTRARELTERLDRQVARITRYYDDLRLELLERAERPNTPVDDAMKNKSRLDALARERELRVAELKKKNALSVSLRLLNLLIVHQPKIQVRGSVTGGSKDSGLAAPPPLPLELVWDPLIEALEPPACPACGRPTFELTRSVSTLVCPNCRTTAPAKPWPGKR